MEHFKQQGTVLIIALFIIVLIQVIMLSLSSRHGLSIRYTTNIISQEQAYQHLLFGEGLAKQRLKQIFQERPLFNLDRYTLTPVTIGNARIQGTIVDLQSRFNINNLILERTHAGFKNFARVPLQLSEDEVNIIIAHVLRDISAKQRSYEAQQKENVQEILGTQPFTDAAQLVQNTYFKLNQSKMYNKEQFNPVLSITEMRKANQLSAWQLQRIDSFITALPEETALNINTANAQALKTLHPNLGDELVEKIIEHRQQSAFTNTNDFLQLNELSELDMSSANITVLSNYYLSSTGVKLDKVDMVLFSLLKVTVDNNETKVSVIWRSIGTI